jgi:hypothetical protein
MKTPALLASLLTLTLLANPVLASDDINQHGSMGGTTASQASEPTQHEQLQTLLKSQPARPPRMVKARNATLLVLATGLISAGAGAAFMGGSEHTGLHKVGFDFEGQVEKNDKALGSRTQIAKERRIADTRAKGLAVQNRVLNAQNASLKKQAIDARNRAMRTNRARR